VHLSCAGAPPLGSADVASRGKSAALTAGSAATPGNPAGSATPSAPEDDGPSDGFEGEIDLDVQSMKYFYRLKGHRLRLVRDPSSTAVQEESFVDCVSHHEYVLFQDKQYTGGPIAGSGQSCPAEPILGSSSPPPPQAMRATGKTDTVAGYPCDLYKATRAGVPGYQEICLSPELAPKRSRFAATKATYSSLVRRGSISPASTAASSAFFSCPMRGDGGRRTPSRARPRPPSGAAARRRPPPRGLAMRAESSEI
jgi:hypothetical protein